MSVEPVRHVFFLVAMSIALAASSAPASAQDAAERPTVQRRFATKKGSIYLHATGTTHIRNDFYDSFGGGADLGFYPAESLGFELRALLLDTRLSNAALDVQERTGLTPDARPQSLIATIGPRWSFGYGKMLTLGRWVVHFDPQLALHAGVARADRRLLPSAVLAGALLVHLRWGIQVKVDLGLTVQGEQRDRGWVVTAGFLPVLGIGWNLSLLREGDE